MSDALPAFEHTWSELERTRAHLVGVLESLRSAGSIETPPERCDHADAVPVESVVTGETLAMLCPACDGQLPARTGHDRSFPPVSNPHPGMPGPAETLRRERRPLTPHEEPPATLATGPTATPSLYDPGGPACP